jgi:ADP-heptose:LPS heptosyltransferase
MKKSRPDASRILVIKLGALGDFIQALGPMAAIRRHHKDAHITLLTTAPYQALAKNCGHFDEVWCDSRPKFFDIKGWAELALMFNHAGFTRVYDLQNNDRTSLYFRLFSRKNRPEWVGTAKGASHRNTDTTRTAGHAYDGHVQTLAFANIHDVYVDRLEWMQASLTSFPLHLPYVLLVPGSAPSRPEKRWPVEKYARLAMILHSLGYQPVILGAKPERELAKEILKQCPQALDLTCQTDIGQIASLAKNAAGAIGNDTGPMHIIAATACPSLALFCRASDPVRHAPKGDYVQVLYKENLEDLQAEEVAAKFKPRQTPGQNNATRH